MHRQRTRKISRFFAATLHVFVGIGALAGGYACLNEPMHPLGVPLTILEHSPFTSFFLPGLFLFGILGIGNIVGLFLFLRFPLFGLVSSLGCGLVLVSWIIIQCNMLCTVNTLHVIFCIIGLAQTAIPLGILVKNGDAAYLLSELA